MIRVFVNGAAGRMGSVTAQAITDAEDLVLVGRGGAGDDLAAMLADTGAEVMVDFTTPTAVMPSVRTALQAGVHPVIGTSGLTSADREELSRRCGELNRGALWIPNFSLGATLLLKLSSLAVQHFPDVEVIEAHHPGKKDAPSGTAVATAEALARLRSNRPSPAVTTPPARGLVHHGIPIHSVRLPGLIAEQEVRFGGTGETLSLTHVTYDRQAFMPGVLLCCRRVQSLHGLVVGLGALLFPDAGQP